MDTIYAVQHAHKRLAYIARTARALLDRWVEHLNAAANGDTTKVLYEHILSVAGARATARRAKALKAA